MHPFKIGLFKNRPPKILCLGAHCDDIEIGCGGTILRLLAEYKKASVFWIVLSAYGKRRDEALKSANKFLNAAGKKNIVLGEFTDGYFPYIGAQIKEYFEELKSAFSPDIIFTHNYQDYHQDHRLVSELTWNTYRNHLIMEYEIIKYDGDVARPNLFVHLTKSVCNKKIDIITKSFVSQNGKDWFTSDVFASILRLRGVESRASEKYAEGFYCRKMII